MKPELSDGKIYIRRYQVEDIPALYEAARESADLAEGSFLRFQDHISTSLQHHGQRDRQPAKPWRACRSMPRPGACPLAAAAPGTARPLAPRPRVTKALT